MIDMKRLILGVAAALMLGAGQAAADGLPDRGVVRGPDGPVATPWNWTGFYLGAGIGGGVLDTDIAGIDGNGEGILGTVVIGYDRQLASGWVAGVFADFDFADISAEGSGIDVDLNHAWSIGARLGGLVTPKTLLYATGGYTQAEFNSDVLGISGAEDGYFVGAGIEHMLRENWSLKLEYRYSDFSNDDDDLTSHTGRLVLNYKFPQRY
jgi:outer membrane immunogenic protein